jgi:hypothetical protein
VRFPAGDPGRLPVGYASRMRYPGLARQLFQSVPGTIRLMNWSNNGTVKAVSPWLGLQIIPLAISKLRVGPSDVSSEAEIIGSRILANKKLKKSRNIADLR